MSRVVGQRYRAVYLDDADQVRIVIGDLVRQTELLTCLRVGAVTHVLSRSTMLRRVHATEPVIAITVGKAEYVAACADESELRSATEVQS